MLAVFTLPHSSSSGSSSDAAQSWNKVRAWFSRERGRAGRLLQVALIGAARAASASTNGVTPIPHRPTTQNTVWNNRPEMESRLRDTQLTMLDWVNLRRAEEYQKMVDGALPPIPSEIETGSRTHAVKVCLASPQATRTQLLTLPPSRESPCHHWTASMMRVYENPI